jgi:hypothetical protein
MEVDRHLSLAEVEPGYEQAVSRPEAWLAGRTLRLIANTAIPKIGIEHMQDASGSSRANPEVNIGIALG